jgi:hypothetical protein
MKTRMDDLYSVYKTPQLIVFKTYDSLFSATGGFSNIYIRIRNAFYL